MIPTGSNNLKRSTVACFRAAGLQDRRMIDPSVEQPFDLLFESARTHRANRAYEATAFVRRPAGPTAIEMAPADRWVALRSIDATRKTCNVQSDLLRLQV